MRGNYLLLHIELDAIRNFLKHTDDEAGAEIRSVFGRNDAGEYKDIDDFENALFQPLTRQEISARAVYYELNALMERELQASAHLPWLESEKHRGPKTLDWDNMTLDSVRSLKMVEDLRFGEVVNLIEEKYRIRIKDLGGADTFLQVREMVNSFKHRKGLIDFRKQEPKDIKFFAHHKADIEQAYLTIDKTYIFITALWKATGREPSPASNDLAGDFDV